jgi:hypothetical protein
LTVLGLASLRVLDGIFKKPQHVCNGKTSHPKSFLNVGFYKIPTFCDISNIINQAKIDRDGG